ncbi:hypothetical protein BZL30_0799 [Mycobacterium kansasii]|uniref:Uncharacterized protein n=1 Tax=Mycobacterium kansasii TaxID=1768 RepID=A0A1V3XTT4_MYCKA|nr:hypothetical protein MKSMC1_18210 [Mycobacterium kansasii]OOK82653.1 hypothetical protein BZL30_0799 [Mycobacterium kansasii]
MSVGLDMAVAGWRVYCVAAAAAITDKKGVCGWPAREPLR